MFKTSGSGKKAKPMNLIMLLLISFLICACGVKNDPVPPASPAEIGRGKPAFKSDDEPSLLPALPRKNYHDREQKDDGDPDEESR